MRYPALVLLMVLAATCFFESKATAERFTGSGTLGDSTISISGFSSLSFTPTWTFDFETTGQEIFFHQYDVLFDGVVQIPNHAGVFIELVVEGSLTGTTLDINPVPGSELWQMQRYNIPDVTISGTYHSFDFENSFDSTNQSGFRFDTQLIFTDYPNAIEIGSFNTNSIFYRPVNLELEPGLNLTQMTLQMDAGMFLTANSVSPISCPCCDCGDFNEDGSTDGLDFLALQRGFGTSPATLSQGNGNGDGTVDDIDLAIWESHYGDVAPLTVSSAAVPEPTSLALFCLVFGSFRRIR